MAPLHQTARSRTENFPAKEVKKVLRKALTTLEADTSSIREPWEPLLDSLAVVNIICHLDTVLPDVTLAPEKLVRKGGYTSIDDALDHLTTVVGKAWINSRKK